MAREPQELPPGSGYRPSGETAPKAPPAPPRGMFRTAGVSPEEYARLRREQPDYSIVPKALLAWLMNGETGISSLTLAGRFLGFPLSREGYPADPADFRRCVLLMEAVPAISETLYDLADEFPHWKALSDQWDRIETTLRGEFASHGSTDLAAIPIGCLQTPKTYALMRSLLDPIW